MITIITMTLHITIVKYGLEFLGYCGLSIPQILWIIPRSRNELRSGTPLFFHNVGLPSCSLLVYNHYNPI